MKRIIGITAALVFALTTTAQAQTITRDGSAYSGYSNPNNCVILVHDDLPGTLHVNCNKGDGGPARIRYRFLRDVGGQFLPADVEVDWEKRGQDGDASVRWMMPTPRTVRIVVRGYVHIESVTWTQPAA